MISWNEACSKIGAESISNGIFERALDSCENNITGWDLIGFAKNTTNNKNVIAFPIPNLWKRVRKRLYRPYCRSRQLSTSAYQLDYDEW